MTNLAYEGARLRVVKQVAKLIASLNDIHADPFFTLYASIQDGANVLGAVSRSNDWLIRARTTLEQLAEQPTLGLEAPAVACEWETPCNLPTCDRCARREAHRGSRA